MKESTLTNIDLKKIKFSMKKTSLQKIFIPEEELDGIDRNGIGNLGDLLRLVLIKK